MSSSNDSHSSISEERLGTLLAKISSLECEIEKVVIGQELVIRQLLISLLAGGHCLLEGVPGLAKTLMVRTLADAVQLGFRRIQFTPDLMPTDIVGADILEEDRTTGKRTLQFNPGPIFANVLLADEINRTPPKTQSALLEAMQEQQITFGGKDYELPRPFFVLATQNPIEQTGVYPLPEAQLDRFLLNVRLTYPSKDREREILAMTTGSQRPSVTRVVTSDEILEAQALVREVPISDPLVGYVTDLLAASRPSGDSSEFVSQTIRWGAGPRGGQALILAAKARALLEGRLAVNTDDIQAMAAPVFRHRLVLSFRAEAEGQNPDDITRHLLENVPVPSSPLAT